jgi:hypothetical protein
MCLPFFLAGYFVPRSYDRKGLGHFPNQRWSRIGLPLLIFALAVHVPVVYLLAGRPPPATFIGSLYESGWFLVYLHLVPRKLAALLLVLRDLSAVCHPRQVRPLVLAATQ